MNDHISIIHHQPAFLRLSIHAAFLFEILFGGFENTLGEGIQHAVAGAVADDEVVGKCCHILDVEQKDVFALFVFQGFNDFVCKIERFQFSPLCCSGAENSFVYTAPVGLSSLL